MGFLTFMQNLPLAKPSEQLVHWGHWVQLAQQIILFLMEKTSGGIPNTLVAVASGSLMPHGLPRLLFLTLTVLANTCLFG